jgi:hypothetical protein
MKTRNKKPVEAVRTAEPKKKKETDVLEEDVPQKNEKVELVPGNDADLTSDDMEALGPKDLSQDLGDDEDLKHREYPVDFSGKDLDVPGVELDDEQEAKGSEDEENNLYSFGGDAFDN